MENKTRGVFVYRVSMEPSMPKQPNLIYERPAELLQNLIRFDTTNPPGNERACIQYINGLLKEAGIKTNIVARTPGRPNLIARLKGEGKAPPLLLYGHVDVVTTVGQKWTHPPFEAKIVDGYIWGRGALDNKHTVAMYLAAILKANAEKIPLPGDIIFAATVDEEATCEDGVKFLVEQHPDLFKGVRYALGEFGGFTLTISGKRFYPIQIAEKQACPTRVTFHGPGGHGANPVRSGAMAKLAAALRTLDRHSLPVHITPPTRMMIEKFARGMGGINKFVMRQLLNPSFANILLKTLGERLSSFEPLLHNTVSPTMIQASDKRNVIPSEVVLELDGRLLPGLTAADLESELRSLLGSDCAIEAYLPDARTDTLDMSLFEMLSDTLRELDPQGIPAPYVNPAVTDARFLSRLGIQTYGFTPLQLPEDFNFISTVHAANERVPVKALDFGVKAIFKAIQKFH
jgi:acetylornithine deacetylase/succinyl-diaminopimelate desuccinylase-like protein